MSLGNHEQPKSSRAALAWFAVLACGITWSTQVPALLGWHGIGGLVFPSGSIRVTLWGPAIAAVVVVAIFEGATGLKRLRATLWPFVSWRWYALALGVPFATLGLVMAGVALTGGPAPSIRDWSTALEKTLWFTPLFLREELGWRSYFLPALLRTQTPLCAIGWTTLLWALWHVPSWVAVGSLAYAVMMSAAMIPVSVLMGFLFLRTRSVWPCLLFHSAIDFGAVNLLSNPLRQAYAPALIAWTVVLALVAWPAAVALARRDSDRCRTSETSG